jgi:hypothetical protein
MRVRHAGECALLQPVACCGLGCGGLRSGCLPFSLHGRAVGRCVRARVVLADLRG